MTCPWMLVAGDLTPLGGMDRANYALARYLASRGDEVHVVAHRVWPDLSAQPNVTVHKVWRPLERHALGSPLLARAGWRSWQQLQPRGPRAVVNGGNCLVPAANWVHYLHAAYPVATAGSSLGRLKTACLRARDLRAERAALEYAPVVICNSHRTRQDVIERLGVPSSKTSVVYYGSDPVAFCPAGDAERAWAKQALGLEGAPLVGFVGALGDRRKAFDTVFAAWSVLCQRPSWDADLLVVGRGAELAAWRGRAAAGGLAARTHFLGFRDDVPAIFAALDGLVHPARYEAYGLAVHEALCRGVPALVSRRAGVAERYTEAQRELLIDDPDDCDELVEKLTAWRRDLERFRRLVEPVSRALRGHTWDAMAREIVDCVEQAA